MNRRHFLALSSASLVSAAGTPLQPLRAAVIGHTGRGDYGHGMDKIFTDRPGVTVTALADPAEAGRHKAAAALGLAKSYADYREMLEKEKPDVVSVGMRHSDQHRDVILACLHAGAHVYAEKPLARTPGEADELLAAATARNLRVAVAHTTRQNLSIRRLRDAIQQENLLGDLLEMRAFGKQDQRAGGEDLMVLGCHVMDLFRMMAGSDPLFSTARILWKGQPVTKADARLTADNVGLLAGDEVFAQYAFPGGLNAGFTSSARLRSSSGAWGIEFLGSRGSARLCFDLTPEVFLQKSSGWTSAGCTETWVPFDPSTVTVPDRHPLDPVADWLAAVRENREPVCSLRNAAWAVEMVCAAYNASLNGTRAVFPLAPRTHPLEP